MVRLAQPVGVLAAAVILVVACGGSTTPSVPATTPAVSVGVSASAGLPEATPEGSPAGSSAEPGASADPGVSGEPGATAEPSPPPPTGAAACSGSHDNRVFFEAIAAQVDWQVYCAVLPAGWFVDAGSFSLRNGGLMEITYKGPNGARFTLEEGNICSGSAGSCMKGEREIGTASFAERSGTLMATDGSGGLALYVDAGGFPAWSAVGTGLDQATFTQFAAALASVGG